MRKPIFVTIISRPIWMLVAGGLTVAALLLTTSVIASGDGAHPRSCLAIQRAINKLPATGGQVVVRAGTYTCAQPIMIDRDNVDLRGEGPGTLLRLADGANSPVIVLGEADKPEPSVMHRNIRVSDLVIDGNRLKQDWECWEGDCDATHFVRNNGITVRGVSDVLIERVVVFSARSGGLVSERGTRRLTVRDFTAFDNHFDGLAGYKTEDSTFSGLYLYNNCAAGLSFDEDFDNNILSDVIIRRDENSRCEPLLPDGRVGIFMRDSRNNVFHGIQIRNTREHGIFLAQRPGEETTAASGNTFSGVVVSDSGEPGGPSQAGLRVADASVVHTLVVGSQFINNTGECIDPVDRVEAMGWICR